MNKFGGLEVEKAKLGTAWLTVVMMFVGLAATEVSAVYVVEEIVNSTGIGIDIRGLGVNDAGIVTGWQLNGTYRRAYAYESRGTKTVTELPLYSGGLKSEAYGINNVAQPQVVGYVPTSGGINNWHKTRWEYEPILEQWVVTDLGTLPGDNWSVGRAINDLGQIAGGHDSLHASLYLPTAAYGLSAGMNDLGTLGGTTSIGQGINEYGEVVGYAQDGSGLNCAFLWLPTARNGKLAGMNNLQYGGTQSYASGINDSGQIAVYRLYGGVWQSFVENANGSNTQIIKPGGAYGIIATAINNSGVVVGSYDNSSGRFGFVWDSVNGTQTLAEMAGWTNYEFNGISDTGYIVGQGINPSGQLAAFVIVPEPATIGLLCLGGLALIRRKRQ